MPFINANSALLVPGGPKVEHAVNAGKLRVALAEFTFNSDAAGTYAIPEFQFQPGQRILEFAINASASLGTTTFALGVVGDTGRYRAAGTFTTPLNIWSVLTTPNAVTGARLLAPEPIIMTTAVAALPASGRMLLRCLFVDNT